MGRCLYLESVHYTYRSLRKVKKVRFNTWLNRPTFIPCPQWWCCLTALGAMRGPSNIRLLQISIQKHTMDKEAKARKGQRIGGWRIQNRSHLLWEASHTDIIRVTKFSQTQSIQQLRLEPANSRVCIVQLWYLEKKKKHPLVAAHTRSVIYPGDKYWLSPVCVHNSQCLPGQLLTGDGI